MRALGQSYRLLGLGLGLLVLVGCVAHVAGRFVQSVDSGVGGSARHLAAADMHASCAWHQSDPNTGPYKWSSERKTRSMAQIYPGNRARLRTALDRYMQGQQLNLVFVGGSITAGQGAVDAQAFPYWAEEIIKATVGPDRISIHNGAVPGTLSSYMSVCHNVHVPKDADIIFLDYSVNDDYQMGPPVDNAVRRPFERLLRTLLNYPKRPAVIMLHAFIWHRVIGPSGLYWPTSEREFHEFALYYGTPELSVKAAAWRLMHDNVEGYQVHKTRADHSGRFQPEIDHELKGKVFYWDVVHPDGPTGHRFMGELVAQYIFDGLADIKANPLGPEDHADVQIGLPIPMLSDNFQANSDKCFIGPAFKSTCIDTAGWEWKDEGKEPNRPKLGYISDIPGSVLKIKVNTMTGSNDPQGMVTVELSYLKSYVNMGKADISCEGCLCVPSQIDGHHTDHTSQLYLHEFAASQHPDCIVAVRVLPETSGPPGHHKVKIAGVMISEGGDRVYNFGAVQMALEGLKENGAFDMKQWIQGRRLESDTDMDSESQPGS